MNWIIKPGFFQRSHVGRPQPGLDLSRAIGDFLIKHGLAVTKDCCTYSSTGGGGASLVFDIASDVSTLTVPGLLATSRVYKNGLRLALTLNYTVAGEVITFVVGLTGADTIVVDL